MKKFVAILLTLMLVLGVSAAFADDATKTFTKNYNVVGTGAETPAETFSFENITFTGATDTGVDYDAAWAAANLPEINTVSYAKGESGAKDFTITLPENYPSVGVYNYTFTEHNSSTAGVTYNDTTMRLVVTVVEQDGLKRIAAVHCEKDGNKSGSFDNTYSAGQLAVTKEVKGNMADKNKEFEISVTFTAPEGKTVKSEIKYNDGAAHTLFVDGGWSGTQTVTISVKHGETVTFDNLPAGVTYSIEETDAAAKANGETKAEYTVSYDTAKTGTIVADQKAVTTVTNTKDTEIDMGVTTENLPYVLLIGFVVLAGAALLLKRKAHNN